MINQVTLQGRLGKDPEFTAFPAKGEGKGRCKISLATDESSKNAAGEWEQETEWHNLVLWDKHAFRAAETLKQGTLLFVNGKIKSNNWTDKEGKIHYNKDIVVDFMRIVSGGKEKGTTETPAKTPDSTTKAKSKGNTATATAKDEPTDNKSDDLPF